MTAAACDHLIALYRKSDRPAHRRVVERLEAEQAKALERARR
jgi:hypothetical protein